MTPQEFKAWFDGYTEAIGDVPTKKQWTRVKERVAEIDGRTVTERVFVDRYWPNAPRPWYPYYPAIWNSSGAGNISSGTYQKSLSANANLQSVQAVNDMRTYNSLSAMNALGRAEAAA